MGRLKNLFRRRVGHGLVFSFGGSPDKKAMAVRLGGRGLLPEQSVVWRNERQMPYVPTPLLLGDYLHILNDAESIPAGGEKRAAS